MEWKAIKHLVLDEGGFSVEVLSPTDNKTYWLDLNVNTKYKDIDVDWNQYIFSRYSEDDMERSKFQDDVNNFEGASSCAINYLVSKNLFYQDDDGGWHEKRNKKFVK